ncbi:MAG: Holliday junction resolvase RuvX [Pyrinomonas sp.]|uniref:Holliday junction resolvase RuvX n=1 Tax=Pyrinomonas sp. TaxID=2080306 RepID=UPI00332E37CD
MGKIPTPDETFDPGSPLGRVLAVDLGARRIGLAVCDELGLTTRPLSTIKMSRDFARCIALLCAELDVRVIVVGLPLRMDGTEGDAARRARLAAAQLARQTNLPVYLQDERLSTREAEEQLRAAGLKRAVRRAKVDSTAALIILRDFLAQAPTQRIAVE